MAQEQETEVLVVGAGPVGLFTALVLAENGIQVRIIDKEERTAAHSYACALHPRTLKLFQRIGLLEDVLAIGRRIDSVGFYDGPSRQTELRLAELNVEFPFVVVLSQCALERLFEQRLKRKRRIKVEWCHRLSRVEPQKGSVVAEIDKLGETSKGYIVRELDWEVEKTVRTPASFVVGADGYDSAVRQSLGIECESISEPQTVAVYEFQSDDKYENEARVVLDSATTNVFWPQAGNRCRWSLQMANQDFSEESHAKERTDVLIVEQSVDVKTLARVQQRIQERAPWFKGNIKEIDWSVEVQFEMRHAKRFGQNRCWLVGDAAHQTVPAGMQSMNVGFSEAEELAGALTKILREGGSLDLLETYDRTCVGEWQRLLGIKGAPKPRDAASPWVKERCARILPCVPASGQDLSLLLDQLRLDFQGAK